MRVARHDDSFSHAIEALEFDGVLDLVASRCVTAAGRRAVMSLRPHTERDRIRNSLDAIAQTRAFQEARGRLAIIDSAAETWLEKAADKHELISTDGLLDIAAAERAAAALQRHVVAEGKDAPLLVALVESFVTHKDLVKQIDHAVDRDCSIKDDATPELRRLRREILRMRGALRSYVDGQAKKFGSSEYATFNGARYMLLVPRDKVKRKQGIVHATSHSGGSLYYEPFDLVERNNRLETVLSDERNEVARILAELTAAVLSERDTLLGNVDTWRRLDVLSAQALFAQNFDCVTPVASDGRVRLVAARHPLLEASMRDDGGRPVPLDLDLEPGERVLVITGPNAGGKTVALKTIGLAVLTYQSGMPIPANDGSALPLFDRVFADIGDEQSIASSLSTFTSHLRHLDEMCAGADANTLALVDEIGDGTDPDEGAAIAIATLEHLLERGAAVVATTHFGRVKAFALDRDGVANASMLYDDEADTPLYRVLQGTAGRSRGVETARRLDFCEPVIERAEALLGEEAFQLERLLSELESNRLALERERAALDQQSQHLSRLVERNQAREKEMSSDENRHREDARRRAEELLVTARKEIETIVKDIRETQAAKDVVRRGHKRVADLLDEAKAPPAAVARAKNVEPGDAVSISPTGKPSGVVIEVERSNATVEINGKRVTVKTEKLYAPADDRNEKRDTAQYDVEVTPLESTSVDVRGMEKTEALDAVDRFLDSATLNGLSEVTIIHGLGEGVLKRSIADTLKADNRVKSQRAGRYGEGGGGVSVVTLK